MRQREQAGRSPRAGRWGGSRRGPPGGAASKGGEGGRDIMPGPPSPRRGGWGLGAPSGRGVKEGEEEERA